jgi:hypothetical protein
VDDPGERDATDCGTDKREMGVLHCPRIGQRMAGLSAQSRENLAMRSLSNYLKILAELSERLSGD